MHVESRSAGGGAVVHRAWVVHRAVHRAMAGRGLAWVQLTWLEHQLSKVHAAFPKVHAYESDGGCNGTGCRRLQDEVGFTRHDY